MPEGESIERLVFRVIADHRGVDIRQISRATRFIADLEFDSISLIDLLLTMEFALPDGGLNRAAVTQMAVVPRTVGDLIDLLDDDGHAGVAARNLPKPPRDSHAA